MGYLIDTATWDRDSNDKYKVSYGLNLTKEFYKDNKFITSRKEFTCDKCKTEFKSGVVCMGTWGRICYKCAKGKIKEIKKGITELEEYFTELEKQYSKDETKWNKMALISALK